MYSNDNNWIYLPSSHSLKDDVAHRRIFEDFSEMGDWLVQNKTGEYDAQIYIGTKFTENLKIGFRKLRDVIYTTVNGNRYMIGQCCQKKDIDKQVWQEYQEKNFLDAD